MTTFLRIMAGKDNARSLLEVVQRVELTKKINVYLRSPPNVSRRCRVLRLPIG